MSVHLPIKKWQKKGRKYLKNGIQYHAVGYASGMFLYLSIMLAL